MIKHEQSMAECRCEFLTGSFDFYSNREKPSGGERERVSGWMMLTQARERGFQDHERIDS